ncbi:hypothetical protein ABEF93_006270 [Exophiala dermatitidis]
MDSVQQRVKLSWLRKPRDRRTHGVTFGVPWPRGKLPLEDTDFRCLDNGEKSIPLQSWVTACWPDQSIKWTAHAISAHAPFDDKYTIVVSRTTAKESCRSGPSSRTGSPSPQGPTISTISILDLPDTVEVDTGVVRVSFSKSGSDVIRQIWLPGQGDLAGNGHLILKTKTISRGQDADSDNVDSHDNGTARSHTLISQISDVVIEQNGPYRAVVVVRGNHKDNSTDSATPLLPFILRFYFYAGSPTVRIVHTLVFDIDAHKTLVTGIGLRLEVSMGRKALFNRHIQFAGVGKGKFAESVQGFSGLRMNPGEDILSAQRSGKHIDKIGDPVFESRLKWVPAWNDYTLTQLSPDGFEIRKRTKKGCSWVRSPSGTRAGGLVCVGTAQRGVVALGMRDFWERYPTQIDIRNATQDKAGVTLWLYSPEGRPMDMRPYHDGLGQQTYDDQLDALKITYEDWEQGHDTPYGVARTNELYLSVTEASSLAGDGLASMVDDMRNPPLLIADRTYLAETKALGAYWTPRPDHGTPETEFEATLNRNLELLFDFYKAEVEQRRWYGFWDYGDIMHTYDTTRHTWRYDVGGYAWDNSELSPDLWLWLYFLRTGRYDVYKMASALTRHTGEVDVYHTGQWKGLGTRHGVQHWSDSCKQLRISNALYRRFYFYISGGDERVGDLLSETLEGEQTLLTLNPYRKVRKDLQDIRSSHTAIISLGTDWSALAASWLIEWERNGPRSDLARSKLLQLIRGIAQLKNGFVTGTVLYHVPTGTIKPVSDDGVGQVQVSHLSAMFGLVEVCSELISLFPDEGGFRSVWLNYCRYFNADPSQQIERYGVAFGATQLGQGHSRLTAYAARQLGDHELARRAWREFLTLEGYGHDSHDDLRCQWRTEVVKPTETLIPGTVEIPWITTNFSALYGLAAIQNLAWIGGNADPEGGKRQGTIWPSSVYC